jgi:signal transduction histidine kinase
VLSASSLVVAFGALAMRRQRRELELSRELALGALEREHEARLDRAGRAATLGTLAMGIAHEIATPATIIQGRAEQLLPRVAGDERADAAARAIVHQAGRISEVVRGFLDLARGGAPGVQEVDVDDLVAGASSLVEHRFAKARVSLVAQIDPDAADPNTRVRGDPRLLEHALVNLLLNACDACEPGGEVRVEVTRGERDVQIDVVDDGAGIAPSDAQHVVQPFFTTKEAGKGTGLGLAITSEIVRAHRGTLSLEPRAPRGTRARIRIPLTEPT